jgi:hypothetical protein
MLGSAAVFLLFAGGWLRLHRQRRPWEPRRVGGEHVLLSDNLGPAVLGLIRPLIVLPRWALTLPKQDLDTVILHEKEHREARDPALLAVGLLLTALSPWNPMVWWSLSRLRLAVEGDCDGRVLARGVSPKAYMRFLVDVASRGGRVPALVPALVEARNTSLEKRLLMMRSKIGAHRAWASVLAATVGVALIVVACETPVPSEVELDEKAVAAVAQVDCLEGGAIREAVAAGEMTVEEGRALYAKCTEAGEREVRGGIRGRLGTAVREGWITREQAGVVVRELEIEGRRVREALSVEEMTAEEAKLAVIRAEFTAFGTQVEERVAVGELTTVEAREAVGAYQAQVSVVKKVPVDYSAKTER